MTARTPMLSGAKAESRKRVSYYARALDPPMRGDDTVPVIPTKVGIQSARALHFAWTLDPRMRGDDRFSGVWAAMALNATRGTAE